MPGSHNRHHTSAHQFHHASHGGNQRKSAALQQIAEDKDQPQRGKAASAQKQIDCGVSLYLRQILRNKQRNQFMPYQHNQYKHSQCISCGNDNRTSGSLADTAIGIDPLILTGIGSHCHAHGKKRLRHQLFHFGSRRIGSHSHGAKHIQRRLHHNRSHCRNGKLKCHR